MKEYKARDIMTKKLVTLKPSANVFEAIDRLLQHNISGAPVLDNDRKFLGIFSEKNCMQVLLTDRYHEMPNSTVGSYLQENPKTVSDDADILKIGQIFLSDSLRRLPVLRDGVLVGQVSRRDVLRAMSKQYTSKSKVPSRPSRALYLSAVKEYNEVPVE